MNPGFFKKMKPDPKHHLSTSYVKNLPVYLEPHKNAKLAI
jgi:hypothetical protein